MVIGFMKMSFITPLKLSWFPPDWGTKIDKATTDRMLKAGMETVTTTAATAVAASPPKAAAKAAEKAVAVSADDFDDED